MIGPTDHALTPVSSGRVGRIEVGRDHWSFDRVERFFDRWLRGMQMAWNATLRCACTSLAADRWRSADSWPLPGTEFTSFYLHSRGTRR